MGNLRYAAEAGFTLFVRTVWALLRVIGFLVLMRAVRYGRMSARPFGLILAVTTVFAVARLAEPRSGRLLPPVPVVVGVRRLAGAVRGDGLAAVPLRRGARAPVRPAGAPAHHPWVLTARVAALAYAALLSVPFLVAVGAVFTDRAGCRCGPPLLGVWVRTAVCW